MTEISDLSKDELTAIARATELWEEIYKVLGKVEASPRDEKLHIQTELQPGYLGWIGYNEGGCITFQPAHPKDAND